MQKIIRASTISLSLKTFCRGLLSELSEDYEVIALSSPDESLERFAKEEGVRAVGVHMERAISPWKDVVSLVKLVRAFCKEKPDMVHSITPKAGLLCMIAAWIARTPVRIHTFTGLVFPTSKGLKRFILMFTDWLTCACATHIVPEGEGVKQDLINNGITRKPLKVLGFGNVRGIDTAYYKRTQNVMEQALMLRKQWGAEKNHFVFVFVGRIVADKGINELAQAFARLAQKYSDAHLVLVGEEEKNLGPISEKARSLLQTTPRIHSVKWQQDVRSYYAAADALVFPSYREGFPNVVIEAGALELPCIVTQINGSSEIIKHNENGVIIPVKDQNALYEAMRAFIEEIEKTQLMAQKSRPLIKKRYEQSFVRQCLMNYYRETLATVK